MSVALAEGSTESSGRRIRMVSPVRSVGDRRDWQASGSDAQSDAEGQGSIYNIRA